MDAGDAAWAHIEDPISDDFFGFEFDFTGKKRIFPSVFALLLCLPNFLPPNLVEQTMQMTSGSTATAR